MDFNNRVVTTVDLFGQNIWITQTHISTWVIMTFLVILALVIRATLSRFEEIPTGSQNFIEFIVETFDKFVISVLGPDMRHFGNWFFGVFLFVLASNISGLFLLRPPTADISTNLALSISTFAIVHFIGLTKAPIAYFKSLMQPFFIFAPINLAGELSIIISLAFRLFGNLLAGLMILGIIYYLVPWWLAIAIPSVLHAYFDVFSGTIQAFIFTMLSMVYIKQKK